MAFSNILALFTREELRVRVGLAATDPASDPQIDVGLAAAFDLVEKYLDRKLAYDSQVEEFVHTAAYTISLIRYPVESITPTNDIKAKSYHLDKDKGLIHFDSYKRSHDMVISYTGGYKVLPEGLKLAILSVFDSLWGDISGSGGVSTGGIKTIKAGDLSVTYDSAGATSASSGTAMGGYIPAMAKALLDQYRRESC